MYIGSIFPALCRTTELRFALVLLCVRPNNAQAKKTRRRAAGWGLASAEGLLAACGLRQRSQFGNARFETA